MAVIRYGGRVCVAQYACDGAETNAKDQVCQHCKARKAREATAARENMRVVRELRKHGVYA